MMFTRGSNWRGLGAMVLLGFGMLPSPAQGQLSGVRDGAAGAHGSIEGTLLVPPASDRSLDGVVVTVEPTGEHAAVDPEGRYLISEVRPGTYTLVAEGEGFARLKITDVVVRPNRRLTLGTEEMPLLLRDGEVQRLETYVVNASKALERLERVDIREGRPAPFSTANIDLPRTIDDAQPYYVFDRETIEQSGAIISEEFARSRIPMNVGKFSRAQQVISDVGGGANPADNKSMIDLSGVGSEDTLILVNGRRVPTVALSGSQNSPNQPDVNGIPLAAIERIELLPMSGSAIYGGGAVGGVVNIILRQDYEGAELSVTYENLYHSDAPNRAASLVYGESFEEGRTQVLASLSYTDAAPVRYADRENVILPYRDRVWANDPSKNPLVSPGSTPLGTTTNITAVPTSQVIDGQSVLVPGSLFGPGTPDRTFVPPGYAGGGGLAPLEANAGAYNLETANLAVGLSPFFGRNYPLSKETAITAGNLHLRRQFLPRLELFAELSHSKNRSRTLAEPGLINTTVPADGPTNVFNTPVRVVAQVDVDLEHASQILTDDRMVVGFKLELPHDWVGQGDYELARNRTRNRGASFDNFSLNLAVQRGAIDVLRDLLAYPPLLDAYQGTFVVEDGSKLETVNFRAAGPTWPLPGGAIALAGGVGYEKETVHDGHDRRVWQIPRSGPSRRYPGNSQQSAHAYGEAHLPLVSPANAVPAIHQLDVQLAGRLDRFHVGVIDEAGTSPRYSSKNFTGGLRYRPLPDVMLRASYSSAFQPPHFAELKRLPPPLLGLPSFPNGWIPISVRDPKRGGMLAPQATGSFGGNPNVRPEDTRSLHLGVVLEPRVVPGLRIAVDFSRVHQRDVIGTPLWQEVVNSEDLLPGRVTRGAVAPGDAFGVGPITFVDATLMNVFERRSESYNVTLDYEWSTEGAGQWQLFAIGNSWQHYQQQLAPGGPLLEAQQQAKFSVSGGLNWAKGRWSAGWNMRFFGAHRVNAFYHLVQGGDHVAAQDFHGVYVAYAFPLRGKKQGGASGLAGVTIQVGAKNVFDAAPAFDATNPYGFYSIYGDIRMGSYYLTVRKRF